MNKFLLFLSLVLVTARSISQTDTLIWIDFETDPAGFVQNSTPPPGYVNDTLWYNFDADGLNDGSGNGRPLEWFWDYDFEDTINSAYISSSWTNGSIPTENWFVMKSIYISDTNAVLSWKSAPYQTPLYMDGYYVLLSSTNNDITSFTDTLFRAAEYVSLDDPSAPNNYASYTFTPGFVHGADGQYTFDTGDSSRLLGLLRPFTVSLSAYAGKSVYIAFKHHSVDDNLLAIDDILLTGTSSVGIGENSAGVGISAFPIPAENELNLEIRADNASSAQVSVYDIMGRSTGLSSEIHFQEGKSIHSLNLSGLAPGTYQVLVTTAKGSSSLRISVK